MPQATDLVIKNSAAVDKTFALITPAAGDGSVAEWALKEGTISSVFPRLSASSKAASDKRNLKIKFFMPSSYTDTVTGLTNVGSRAEVNTSITIPRDFPEALKSDFVAYATNAYKTTLMQAMWRDALPAT